MAEEKSLLSTIIDSPIEEVDAILKEGKFSITVLTNLKKGLELQYQRVTYTKDGIVQGIKNKSYDNMTEAENTLKNLYVALQLIEDRAKLIQQYINDLKVDFRN